MRILSIETSCDETALSIVECAGVFPTATYTLMANALLSQTDIHAEYGGVFPMIAKREHVKVMVPLLQNVLAHASLLSSGTTAYTEDILADILLHEDAIISPLTTFFCTYEKPAIDAIAVTNGPGLAPALWVGVNFARALGAIWNIPVYPVDHMEGHILASLFQENHLAPITFPAIALLISGGHTELVVMRTWNEYLKIGETRDDAVGEAFDKVARMLGLPYPGGPHISTRAAQARAENIPHALTLPRPMLNSPDYDFSFSGLKTAVLYGIREKELTHSFVSAVARDFEDAVADVLIHKTIRAHKEHGNSTIIVGGGVSANTHIRTSLSQAFLEVCPEGKLYVPPHGLSTDNSIMIALAGHAGMDVPPPQNVGADSNKTFRSVEQFTRTQK